jgi:hypothetical protein
MNASSLASDCHHGTARKLAETDKVPYRVQSASARASDHRAGLELGAGSWELRAGGSPARQGRARFGSTKPLRGSFFQRRLLAQQPQLAAGQVRSSSTQGDRPRNGPVTLNLMELELAGAPQGSFE